MAITRPLNETACDQADDVFYCLHPEMAPGNVREPLDSTSTAHADMRAEWCDLYDDILAHNADGSRPFPDCSDASHDHHDPACAHCAAPPEPAPPEPDPDPVDPCVDCNRANLVVIVKDADGNPVEGADVFVAGLGGQTTDASGVADFGEVDAGAYDVSAEKDGHGPVRDDAVGPDEKSAVDVPAGQTTVVEMVQHPVVTVTITLAQAVACPGHPLKITAVGTPAGGTFAWTANGHGSELVNAAGTASLASGPEVHLRCFAPDDSTGEIPERQVDVEVTYTHPTLGSATAAERATVHKIEFDVTNTAVTRGFYNAQETAASLTLQALMSAGTPAISTTPSVKIKLDASCPRKAACAGNHKVGWLQVMLSDPSLVRYTHTLQSGVCPFPIRDAIAGAPHPWYIAPASFTGDNDNQAAHFEDSPGWLGITWTDTRGAAPGVPAPPPPPPAINRQLRRARQANTFNAWLAVRNEEWWAHDQAGSFAFQRHLDWSNDLDCTVTTTNAVGSRCAPRRARTTIDGQGVGKGGASPLMSLPIYNTTISTSISAAAGLP